MHFLSDSSDAYRQPIIASKIVLFQKYWVVCTSSEVPFCLVGYQNSYLILLRYSYFPKYVFPSIIYALASK
jgi:hypothetical protein